MSYLCNRNRETKIDNNKVPWMSGLVSGLAKPCTAVRIRQEPPHHFKNKYAKGNNP
mgnify:CR=1 FL=1